MSVGGLLRDPYFSPALLTPFMTSLRYNLLNQIPRQFFSLVDFYILVHYPLSPRNGSLQSALLTVSSTYI
jgi:hypothetical protein